MTTRNEQRERLRRQRIAAQEAASRADKRRLFVGYAVAGVIVAAVIAGVVIVITGSGDAGRGQSSGDFPDLAYVQPLLGSVPAGLEPDGRDGTDPPPLSQGDLENAAEAADCQLQLNLEDEGATHFTNEDRSQAYKTNPPTSGDHFFSPTEAGSGALADGAYLDFANPVRTVHSMEHGRVLIQYSPELAEAAQLEIKGVFEESPQGVLLFPNPDMPFEVAITAWTQLAGCETYQGAATLDVLRVFRDVYRGQGPENVPLAASG